MILLDIYSQIIFYEALQIWRRKDEGETEAEAALVWGGRGSACMSGRSKHWLKNDKEIRPGRSVSPPLLNQQCCNVNTELLKRSWRMFLALLCESEVIKVPEEPAGVNPLLGVMMHSCSLDDYSDVWALVNGQQTPQRDSYGLFPISRECLDLTVRPCKKKTNVIFTKISLRSNCRIFLF